MSDEKKVMAVKPEKKQEKLTYEQLEAYAQQTTMQAQRIFQENQMLKNALEKERANNNFKEIDLVLKCLDHTDLFSEKFIKAIVARLEELLTPIKEEPKDEAEKENKEG